VSGGARRRRAAWVAEANRWSGRARREREREHDAAAGGLFWPAMHLAWTRSRTATLWSAQAAT
jgi:hypothetical protein